nr:proline-rich receptor-like protein kinase PERK3 isoform X2 [Ipomoea batatas]
MFHYKRYSNRNSDTASSNPSAAGGSFVNDTTPQPSQSPRLLPGGWIPNSGMGRDSSTKVEFKQRLSIASGTAKGMNE